MKTMTEWIKDRPRMAGYGVPDNLDGTLEWSAVVERVTAAKNYWICTASSDGAPHAVPVWGAFLDDTLYFGVGPRSARNLASNPRVSVHLESGTEVVILEGSVTTLRDPDPGLSKQLDDTLADKYDYRPSSESDDPVGDGWFILAPSRVIAWAEFPADATRWTRTASTTSDLASSTRSTLVQ